MKKLFVYLFAAAAIGLSACKGNNQTGGDLPDSGVSNVGGSGVTDSAAVSAGKSSPAAVGASGTDTSANGKSTANPTVDTSKTNPK